MCDEWQQSFVVNHSRSFKPQFKIIDFTLAYDKMA